MREHAVVQKVGNRSGIASNRGPSTAQKPARRGRGQGGESLGQRVKSFTGYLPTILKVSAAVVVILLLFQGYRTAASASFFQIRKVEVQGTSHASLEEVQAITRREVSKTGVWKSDLNELSAKLQRVPWVRNAIVTRVLPDAVRVRIIERQPVAVVRTTSGHFRWVDEDAVLLGEMKPTDPVPSFFLRGLSEDESETANGENVDRVKRFIELQRECEAAGISERVSEVDLTDVRDVRAQLSGADSQIEVRLGSQDLAKRLKRGLTVLDQLHQSQNGQLVSYLDVGQANRTVIGLASGAHLTTTSGDQSEGKEPVSVSRKPDAGPKKESKEKAKQPR